MYINPRTAPFFMKAEISLDVVGSVVILRPGIMHSSVSILRNSKGIEIAPKAHINGKRFVVTAAARGPAYEGRRSNAWIFELLADDGSIYTAQTHELIPKNIKTPYYFSNWFLQRV